MSLSIRSIPELDSLPRKQQWRMLAGCHLRSFLYWQTWAGLCVAVLIAAAGQLLVRWIFPALTEREAPLYGTSGAVVGWVIGGHLSWKIRVRVVRRLIRKKFPNLCPTCGYDLRASPGNCPECGAEAVNREYHFANAA